MFNKCWIGKRHLMKTDKEPRHSETCQNSNDLLDNQSASCSTPRVHQLWSYFYCIVLCLIQSLLVYRAALTIGENMSNPYMSAELYGYTVAVALSITVSLLAVAASLFRLGNFANDGDKLGKVIVRIQKNKQNSLTEDNNVSRGDNPNSSGSLPMWRRCWQRAAPFAPTCHLISAFLLLIPRNFLLAKSLAQGARPDLATATEIDVFIRRRTTRLDLYLLLTLAPSTVTNATTSLVQPLSSFVLGADRPSALTLPSAEWANYILGAVVFASRYPAVFWYTNKSIAILFVFQQILSILNCATSHAGFVLLFNLASMAKLVPFDFLLHPVAVFLLYIVSLMVILVSSMIVFEYGYEQYLKQIRTYQRLVRNSSSVSHQAIVVSSNGRNRETELVDSGHDSSATLMMMSSAYSWRSYCSNIAAVIALICLTATKVPLVYDYMTVYRLSEDWLIFICLIADAVYFFYWILIWFIFTLKQNWTFLIQHPFIYFRDVAIDSTDNNKARSLLTASNGNMYQTGRGQNCSSSILAASMAHRNRNPASVMSRGSSPTRSLMDIAAMTGPLVPGYGQHQPRLPRPMSALVNPQTAIANGLCSPSLPNCKASLLNGNARGLDDGNIGPSASSTLHIYRQSLREKNISHFHRGGTLVTNGYNGTTGLLGASNDPKRRSLPAKHFSALNGISFPTTKMNGTNCQTSVNENNDRQSLNGWAISTSGTATDIIPEDALVDSFKPHVPLKLSASSTCYQLDGRLSSTIGTGLHESRSDFLLMSTAANGSVHTQFTGNGNPTTASFASIPSIIKKRPAPPPRQSSTALAVNDPYSPPNEETTTLSNGGLTLTSSSASQV